MFGLDSGTVALRSWVAGEISSAAHSISDVTGLQIALDAKADGTLTNYSEAAGSTTTIAQYFDDATPVSTHLAWNSGSYTNVANSHQVITIPAYTTFSGLGTGTCYMSVEL